MGGAAWRGLLRRPPAARRGGRTSRRPAGAVHCRDGALQGRRAAGAAIGRLHPGSSLLQFFSSSVLLHPICMVLRFLLLAATTVNAGRIISQIREQLKFVGVVDPRAARSKKLKGKASATSTDGAILHALRSGLRFKNMLCEAFLKELKSVDHPKDHKVIDVWLIMLIYAKGGALQKSAEKILKSKILQGYIRDTLFNQCIRRNTELVKLIGSLITHIGSGVSYEVSSALDIMISLTSNHSEELIPIASHIAGIVLSHVFCLTSYRAKDQFRELLKKGSLCQPIVQVWKQLTIMGSSEHIN